MDFNELYHFFFETMPGIATLIGIFLVLSILVSVILERRTKKLYRDRPADDDEWAFSEDDENEKETS